MATGGNPSTEKNPLHKWKDFHHLQGDQELGLHVNSSILARLTALDGLEIPANLTLLHVAPLQLSYCIRKKKNKKIVAIFLICNADNWVHMGTRTSP